MRLFGVHRDEPDQAVTIEPGWATAVGGRADNQDRCAVTPAWAVISDGAGGHAGGARAAATAVTVIAAALAGDPGPGDAPGSEDADSERLAAAVDRANAAVRAGRARDRSVASMAATVTVAVARRIGPDGSRWLVANVGDSPAWRVGAAGAERLTHDHNVAGELVRAGMITAEEARTHPGRHRITRALGSAETVEADVVALTLAPGEALVLATDGAEVVPADQLAALVRTAPNAEQAARAVVDAALARDTADNVTAVVLRHPPSSGHAPGAD